MTGHINRDTAPSLSLRLEHEMRDLVSRLRSLHHADDELANGVALIDEAALRMAKARALAEQQEATLRRLLERDLGA